MNLTSITSAEALFQVEDGDTSDGNRIMLAVEIPLILLATSTVALRIYSRLGVKRKLAVDDVLIVLGLVSSRLRVKLIPTVKHLRVLRKYGQDLAEKTGANID